MVEHPKEEGFQCYQWYHYLWHLIAVGAIKTQGGSDAQYAVEPDAWALLKLRNGELPGSGEMIAMIDTGVNDRHPNLAGRVEASVDFAAHPYGATYGAQPDPAGASPRALAKPHAAQSVRRGLETVQPKSLVSDDTWSWASGLLSDDGSALLTRLQAGRGITHHDAHISRQRYSGHGTACAGLMAGAPPRREAGEKAAVRVKAVPLPDDGEGPLPYWGVAPGASILPIIVSAEPTAIQLILALLYARDNEVSVIHFPREAMDPRRAHKHHRDLEESRYDSDPTMKLAWDVFAKILEAVSGEIPVVCAAGNNGYDHVIYPASKAAADDNGIIAVGAVTYNARRASYSNYSRAGESPAVTIAAPSDDEEMYTRYQLRLDRESPRWREHNFALHLHQSHAEEVDYSPQSLVTTDVPGPRGYAEGILASISTEEVEEDDRAALYALFGGTSGASAIVAGAVALLQSKVRAAKGGPLGGKAVKDRLKDSGQRAVAWPWLADSSRSPKAVSVDRPNGEAKVAFEQQFGSGVLDLRALLGSAP